eukprot:8368772-Lingulodinium_polyedra.AAC.1
MRFADAFDMKPVTRSCQRKHEHEPSEELRAMAVQGQALGSVVRAVYFATVRRMGISRAPASSASSIS